MYSCIHNLADKIINVYHGIVYAQIIQISVVNIVLYKNFSALQELQGKEGEY